MPLTQQKLVSFENFKSHNKLLEENSQLQAEQLIGDTPLMHVLFSMIDQFARCNNPILITGETGTGKKLVAKTLHYKNHGNSRPFISTTGTHSQSTGEIELFGLEQETSSEAFVTRESKLGLAQKGTIFIDEIDCMRLGAQEKLLWFIKNKKAKRKGDRDSINLDVRVIAASNKDLSVAVASETFLADLYYYLNVFKIEVPPLRFRKADIPLIVNSFMEKFSRQQNTSPKRISQNAIDLLMRYDWPGNVNELRNIIERAVVLGEGEILHPKDFPEYLSKQSFMTLKEIEKRHIMTALKKADGNKTKAASLLDISRAAFYTKLKNYQEDLFK